MMYVYSFCHDGYHYHHILYLELPYHILYIHSLSFIFYGWFCNDIIIIVCDIMVFTHTHTQHRGIVNHMLSSCYMKEVISH